MRPGDDIGEQDLPGIGRRYDLRDADGNDVAVIIHHSGRRDLYGQRGGRGDMDLMLSLTDDQARRLGAIIGGAYFKPAAVSEIEAVVGGLAIDWVTLRPDSPAIGRSLADLEIRKRTGATVAAILRGEGAPAITPEPDEILSAGDRLVVMGQPSDLATFMAEIVG
jgi:TrkA domain protein